MGGKGGRGGEQEKQGKMRKRENSVEERNADDAGYIFALESFFDHYICIM